MFGWTSRDGVLRDDGCHNVRRDYGFVVAMGPAHESECEPVALYGGEHDDVHVGSRDGLGHEHVLDSRYGIEHGDGLRGVAEHGVIVGGQASAGDGGWGGAPRRK